ncbi:MAG: hypothetical protein ABIZ04_20585 [Opitutus sp.]
MKTTLTRLIFVSLFVAQSASTAAFGNVHQRYNNLHNPTEYVYDTPLARVMDVLRDPKRVLAPPPEPLHGVMVKRGTVVYSFGLSNHYTKRYWAGKEERSEEVDPPEAGRIGTIDADFDVRVSSKDDSTTVVSVSVEDFSQQVGRRYKIFPHFHKSHVSVNVKSDTYYEYLFLLRLGELLGEKNMPAINGTDD